MHARILCITAALITAANTSQAQPVFGDAREWLSAMSETSYRSWSIELEDGSTHEARQVNSRLFSAPRVDGARTVAPTRPGSRRWAT
jgi:hypothetical protein